MVEGADLQSNVVAARAVAHGVTMIVRMAEIYVIRATARSRHTPQ